MILHPYMRSIYRPVIPGDCLEMTWFPYQNRRHGLNNFIKPPDSKSKSGKMLETGRAA